MGADAWRFTAGILIPIGTALTVMVKVTDTSARAPHAARRVTWER